MTPRVAPIALLVAAILAVATPASADGDRELARPIQVRGRLATGANFTGSLQAWGPEGLRGSFGSHRWDELVAADLKRIYQQVMDRRDAAQWLRLGELLLGVAGGERFADEAFAQAKRLGAAPDAVAAARTRGIGAAAEREERERMDQERRLQDRVLADDATARPWPVLTDAERTKALETMRAEAKSALDAVGISFDPVETDRFIVCGDVPKAQLQRWARDLDTMYARVAEVLDVPKDVNLFWGKAVILAFRTQDTFQVVEAAAFRHKAAASLRGICHQRGPQVYISVYLGNDELDFASTLVHEATHGVVHRWVTAARLPEWANEGFAEWVARACVPRSPVDANRRPQGLAFFRQGGDATKVMALDGAKGTWPGDNAIGYSVGFLLVDLMIAERPRQFAQWVRAVKGGKEWREALAAEFGMTPEALAQAASRWYRTNDGPPRRNGRQ